MNEKHRRTAQAVAGGLVLFAALGLWFAAGDSDKEAPAPAAAPAAPTQPEIRADFATIYGDYAANPIAAEAKYLGAPIVTVGQVERIGGTTGAALLYLRQPGQPKVKAAAWLARSEEKAVMAMKVGDIVALQCKGDMPVDNRIVFRRCVVIPG